MSEMMQLEVEVKFWIPDLVAFRQHLLAQGGTLKKERVFEQNVRFDTPGEALRERLELLRLREDTAVKITFKGPADAQIGSEVKVREELEMTVSDFNTASLIFQRLGFVPKQTYEKYRETFQVDGVEVVLDEMPFGNFIELEGAEADIKAVAARLSLPWEKRLLTNYLSLMAQIKGYYNLGFDDITFANFEGFNVSFSDLFAEQ